MDKQILKAVEEAYRKGLREGNSIKDIKPYLMTSQVVAHEVANKFCKADVIKSVCPSCGSDNIRKGIITDICKMCDKSF